MGCRRMLGVEDRAAIMAGVNAGLSQTRIAHLIGRSPSVVCRQIARHTGPDGQYRAEEADKAARAARHRSKKRLLDCDKIRRCRAIADLPQGHKPRQISAPLHEEAYGTLPSMDTSPDAQGHTISHEAIYTRGADTDPFAGESQVVTTDTSSGTWSHSPSATAHSQDRQLPESYVSSSRNCGRAVMA